MSLFPDITLTPADLPQPPAAPQSPTGGAAGGELYFYGPGASGAHASPHANYAAEAAPVFGSDGP